MRFHWVAWNDEDLEYSCTIHGIVAVEDFVTKYKALVLRCYSAAALGGKAPQSITSYKYLLSQAPSLGFPFTPFAP
jgi:hypothetical protein